MQPDTFEKGMLREALGHILHFSTFINAEGKKSELAVKVFIKLLALSLSVFLSQIVIVKATRVPFGPPSLWQSAARV